MPLQKFSNKVLVAIVAILFGFTPTHLAMADEPIALITETNTPTTSVSPQPLSSPPPQVPGSNPDGFTGPVLEVLAQANAADAEEEPADTENSESAPSLSPSQTPSPVDATNPNNGPGYIPDNLTDAQRDALQQVLDALNPLNTTPYVLLDGMQNLTAPGNFICTDYAQCGYYLANSAGYQTAQVGMQSIQYLLPGQQGIGGHQMIVARIDPTTYCVIDRPPYNVAGCFTITGPTMDDYINSLQQHVEEIATQHMIDTRGIYYNYVAIEIGGENGNGAGALNYNPEDMPIPEEVSANTGFPVVTISDSQAAICTTVNGVRQCSAYQTPPTMTIYDFVPEGPVSAENPTEGPAPLPSPSYSPYPPNEYPLP